jgi:predicted metal-dependent RNase
MTDEHKTYEVSVQIGFFYFEKAEGEDTRAKIDKAYKEIESLGITRIEVENDTATIYLSRPGLIIGRKGENIQKLLEFIQKRVSFEVKLNIKETKDVPGLFCFSYIDDGIDEDATDMDFDDNRFNDM